MNENIERNVERQAAYQDGLYQGKEENKKEMIISLYKEKVPKETICKCSGLTLEDIEKIINETDV